MFCRNCNKKTKRTLYCSQTCKEAYLYPVFTDTDLQLTLSAFFGDGCFHQRHKFHELHFNSKSLEYLKYKKTLCNSIRSGKVGLIQKNGYSQKPLYQFGTNQHPEITKIAENSIQINLNLLTDQGVALWLYDDGSLHQQKHFFNLNTHSFSTKIQEQYFVPFFNSRYNAYPVIAYDRKNDGRVFTYLRFNKKTGASSINDLLHLYPIADLSYKTY